MDEQTNATKAKGGYARAEALSPEERKRIAREAALARWDENIPKAEYGSSDRPLRIGDWEIPCYVLNDGRRVLVQRGMMDVLDMKQGTAGRGDGDRLAKFTATKAINPFVSDKLAEVIKNPIVFHIPKGGKAYGYEATILADLCDSVLEARKSGKLHYQQEHIAIRCEMLVRAFAKVGIVALVDEVTGYQEIRHREALQALLDKYLRKEFAAWAKRFPNEFYEQIFRLRQWNWQGRSKNPPQVVAKYTTDIVYARLAPGIVKELEARNPKDDKGNRKAKHHQWLTEDIGHPALERHLYAVIGLMRIADSWDGFKRLLDRAYPKRGDTLQLNLFNDLQTT
jgi:hypothetical protein